MSFPMRAQLEDGRSHHGLASDLTQCLSELHVLLGYNVLTLGLALNDRV